MLVVSFAKFSPFSLLLENKRSLLLSQDSLYAKKILPKIKIIYVYIVETEMKVKYNEKYCRHQMWVNVSTAISNYVLLYYLFFYTAVET